MKNVALHNLGCKVNAYEMDVMQQMLQQKGYKVVSFDESADIYIVNTCTVTNIADRKSRQMLHRAKKKNPQAIVVAVGCYVQTGKEEVALDECIDLAIGNNRKKDLIPILEQYIEGMKSSSCIIDINNTKEYEEMKLEHTAEHTRAYIKIQDGCNQFCTYCIIPYARGRVRSRQKEDIISEVEGLVTSGYQEIVLTGIHISSYGIDFSKKLGEENKEANDYLQQPSEHFLLELIKKLNKIKGLYRIRLGSLEPRIITEEFVKTLKTLNKVCPHFHLSLQSGCDETLKRMNRRYSASQYYEKVQLLRNYFENAAITTDIIVGFPGETEEEFQITKKYLEELQLYEMHIFKYSKRKGTKAAVMEHQVDAIVKNQRSVQLLELNDHCSQKYCERFIGKQVEVLVEETKEINGKIYQLGHTKEYLKVAIDLQKNYNNQMILVTIQNFLTQNIMLAI